MWMPLWHAQSTQTSLETQHKPSWQWQSDGRATPPRKQENMPCKIAKTAQACPEEHDKELKIVDLASQIPQNPTLLNIYGTCLQYNKSDPLRTHPTTHRIQRMCHQCSGARRHRTPQEVLCPCLESQSYSGGLRETNTRQVVLMVVLISL